MFEKLQDLHVAQTGRGILELFVTDPHRADGFSAQCGEMRLDYSKTMIDDGVRDALLALCDSRDVAARRTATSASASICARSIFEAAITSASLRMPTALNALFSSRAENGVWSSAVRETLSS